MRKENPLRTRHFHSRKGPPCSVCAHKDRSRIEQGRVAGISLDNLAKKFGIGRDSIHRHWTNHVSDDVKAQYLLEVPIKDLAARASDESVSVLEYLSIVRAVLLQQFQLAASCNDRNGTAVLGGRLTEVLREIGRLTGEILRAPAVQNILNSVTFMNSPDFVNIQQMLIKRLAGYPEAMAAVVEGLRDLDAGNAPARPARAPDGNEKIPELEAAHVAG
jgi:hypothetical protein